MHSRQGKMRHENTDNFQLENYHFKKSSYKETETNNTLKIITTIINNAFNLLFENCMMQC